MPPALLHRSRPRALLLTATLVAGLATSLVAGLLAGPPALAAPAPSDPLKTLTEKGQEGADPLNEQFHYRWRLTNLLGFFAGLFFPSRGEGVLSFEINEAGHLASQLHITSRETESDEFWLYGAVIDPRQMRTLRAWSAYKYGDKNKRKDQEVNESGVVDVASGIYRIRQDPPKQPTPMRIWSDGKIYSVRVVPRGVEEVKVGDEVVAARLYSIRNNPDSEDREWKGELDLWLAQNDQATPVRILIKRSGLGVLLTLEDQRG
ncbi:MAG: DUF3108 domain-containing protein [Acidobacteriota bacterium]|nr:DUF3108 domain-containing protein [Acidobacteriota bacterium]